MHQQDGLHGEDLGFSTMLKVAMKDPKMTLYKRIRPELVTGFPKAKRNELNIIFFYRLKCGRQVKILFTEKKFFTVQTIHNP